LFYADVDVSDIDLSSGAVVETWNGDDIAFTAEVEYDSTSNLRIWMPVNTETISVAAIGPSTTLTTIAVLTETLVSGTAWVFDAGEALYYQDIDISSLGTSADWFIYDVKDNTSGMRIEPSNVSNPVVGTIRVWMSDNTHSLDVTIIG
jgi:hypothetical protein